MRMHETVIDLPGWGPATAHRLHHFAFGAETARPHVYVQGGLHADEGPGMLTARLLIDRLTAAEAAGSICGRITVVPAANPIGLGQFINGDQSGRFDLHDGRNFNRDYPDLAPAAGMYLAGRLGADPALNTALIRAALLQTLAALPAVTPGEHLRHTLMRLALPADIVLDLHCDGEAVVHLYTQPSSLDRLSPLVALSGCRAVLLAEVSGGNPFDEAVSRPWLDLARQFPDAAVPPACAACTLELRGRTDVQRDLAGADADSIMGALVHMGAVTGPAPALPAGCAATPLAGSQALVAPVAGLLSFVAPLGAMLAAGDPVAEITHPLTGAVTAVAAGTSGVFYARPATRIAEPGKRLGKIAGSSALRSGLLLSP